MGSVAARSMAKTIYYHVFEWVCSHSIPQCWKIMAGFQLGVELKALLTNGTDHG